ncbi:MAG: hypothetical protein WC455_09610 [Dehalococcoidia bacterium]
MSDPIYSGSPVSNYASVPAPSPFVGLRSEMERPVSRKEKQLVARWLYKRNGTLRYIIQQKATYPLTEIEIELAEEDAKLAPEARSQKIDKLKKDYEALKLIPSIKRIGIDLHLFNIAFAYLWICPAISLKCSKCGETSALESMDDDSWKMECKKKELIFTGTCPKCKEKKVSFSASEEVSATFKNVRISHFDPTRVDMKTHEITGDYVCWYTPSEKATRRIKRGDKWYIKRSSLDYLKAAMTGNSLLLDNDNLFIIRIEDPTQVDMPWPEPGGLKPFNQLYNNLLLEKATEAIAIQHTVPLPMFFPRLAGDENLSKGSILLNKFRDELFGELKKWVKNPSHFVISNIPIGVEQALGRGNMLFPTAQIQYNTEEAMLAMGSPRGLFNGSAHYAGSTAAMRIVENSWIETYNGYNQACKFFSSLLQEYMGTAIPKHTLAFKEFRRVDDVMYKNQVSEGFRNGAFCHDTYCKTLGLDPVKERAGMKEYQIWQAQVSAAVQDIAAKSQADANIKIQGMMSSSAASDADDMLRVSKDKTLSLFESYTQKGIPPEIAASIILQHNIAVNQFMARQAAIAKSQRATDTFLMREQANAQTSLNRGQKDRFLFSSMEAGGVGQPSLQGEDRISFITGLLSSMEDQERTAFLNHVHQYDQETYNAIVSALRAQGVGINPGEGAQNSPQQANNDGTQPMPDVLPPRREGMG